MEEIIGQTLGVIATLITFLSYQMNTKRSVLITQTTATAFTCVSYLLLGATPGFVLNIVCILRNVIYYFQKAQSRTNLACARGGNRRARRAFVAGGRVVAYYNCARGQYGVFVLRAAAAPSIQHTVYLLGDTDL